MINFIDDSKRINITVPTVFREPVKPYINTALIKDWSYFFRNNRDKEWDFDNTDWSGAETLLYCFQQATLDIAIELNTINCKNFNYAFNSSYFNKVRVNTSKAENLAYAFRSAVRVTEIEFVGTTAKASNLNNCFNGCTNLKSIKGLDFSGVTAASGITTAFQTCPLLEDCVITGTLKIYSNNFRLSPCPKLSAESVKSFARAIENAGGGTYTLYFGAENLAKLTDDEKNRLIDKGFILA